MLFAGIKFGSKRISDSFPSMLYILKTLASLSSDFLIADTTILLLFTFKMLLYSAKYAFLTLSGLNIVKNFSFVFFLTEIHFPNLVYGVLKKKRNDDC